MLCRWGSDFRKWVSSRTRPKSCRSISSGMTDQPGRGPLVLDKKCWCASLLTTISYWLSGKDPLRFRRNWVPLLTGCLHSSSSRVLHINLLKEGVQRKGSNTYILLLWQTVTLAICQRINSFRWRVSGTLKYIKWIRVEQVLLNDNSVIKEGAMGRRLSYRIPECLLASLKK